MTRIRQVALVARNLDPVVADLCAVFGLEVAFNDPGVAEFGLRNAVMPVGSTFLEVVSPAREGTTAGRLLDKRGGDGGYMVIVQTDDLEAARTRLGALGVRIVWQIALDDIATLHLHPRDVGGAIVSLDQPRPPESWRWGGPEWQSHVRTDVVDGITSVTLEAENAERLAARWTEVLGLWTPRRAGTTFELALEGGGIRFVPAAGSNEGIARVGLGAVDAARAVAVARERGIRTSADTVWIGGLRFDLERPAIRARG